MTVIFMPFYASCDFAVSLKGIKQIRNKQKNIFSPNSSGICPYSLPPHIFQTFFVDYCLFIFSGLNIEILKNRQ